MRVVVGLDSWCIYCIEKGKHEVSQSNTGQAQCRDPNSRTKTFIRQVRAPSPSLENMILVHA